MEDGMVKRIYAALARDSRINMAYVEVSCQDGTAILRGKVESEDLRSSAEAVVAGVPGVKRVENRLLVTPGYPYAEVNGPSGL